MKDLDNLIAVLCDPGGKCSIHGSDEDRQIVDESLTALKAALAAPQPVSLTDVDIRRMWLSENGLEDCDMCKIDDFKKVAAYFQAAIKGGAT